MPTSIDQVRLLIECPPDITDDMLDLYISTAVLLVSEDLSGKGLSEARLAQIELYLSAHFAAVGIVERGGLTSSRTGDQSQDTYGNKAVYKAGLGSTRYGQSAIALDTSGTLQQTVDNQEGKKPALFNVISTAGSSCYVNEPTG